MRQKDLHRKQIKRVLLYWLGLSNQFQREDVLYVISELFHLTPSYVWAKIIMCYNLDELADVKIPYLDLDKQMIQSLADRLHDEAKRQRKEQLNLFNQ